MENRLQWCFSTLPAQYRLVVRQFAQKLPGICRSSCVSGHPYSMACLAGARRTASMLSLVPQSPLLLQKAPKATRMVIEARPIISHGSSMSIQAKNNISSLLQHPWWVYVITLLWHPMSTAALCMTKPHSGHPERQPHVLLHNVTHLQCAVVIQLHALYHT